MVAYQKALVTDDDEDDLLVVSEGPSTPQKTAAEVLTPLSSSTQSSKSSQTSSLGRGFKELNLEPSESTTPIQSSSGKKRRRQEVDLDASPSRARASRREAQREISRIKLSHDSPLPGKAYEDTRSIDLTGVESIDLVESDEIEFAKKLEEEEALLRRLKDKNPKCPPRNMPLVLPFVELDGCRWHGSTLKKEKLVGLHDRRFLWIKCVVKNIETDEIHLRGWSVRRADEAQGMLELVYNELYIHLDVDDEDPRPAEIQGAIEVGLTEIKSLHRVVFTNELYQRPHDKYNNFSLLKEISRREKNPDPASFIKENQMLVIRHKLVATFGNAQCLREINRDPSKWSGGIIGKKMIVLSEAECTNGKCKSSTVLRSEWRGVETRLGGSFELRSKRPMGPNPNLTNLPNPNKYSSVGGKKVTYQDLKDDDAEKTAELRRTFGDGLRRKMESQRADNEEAYIAREEDASLISSLGVEGGGDRGSQSRSARSAAGSSATPIGQATRQVMQYYTYGDAFCGAGGMTRAAYIAKLRIMWGLDFNSDAGATWQRNFPHASLYEMWANEFINLPDADRQFVVDILHLSPPCQFFSPVHTRAGRDDEQNTASLFAVEALLDKGLPRIATLEETPGLLRIHKDYFNSLISMFTRKGFSISWQLVKMENYGLAQRRHRLIIVASCPGEPLPDFLPPTHSEHGRDELKPFVTPSTILREVKRGAENHEIQPASKRYTAWDDTKLINTITCGSTLSHPSGTRSCTHREFAALTGYPNEHVFHGKHIRKQIGNSVPPVFGAELFRHIIEHFKRVDGLERRRKERASAL